MAHPNNVFSIPLNPTKSRHISLKIPLNCFIFGLPNFYFWSSAVMGFEKVGQYSGYPAEGIHKYFLQKEIAE